MMMLATTPTGDAYTFAEIEDISTNAGFTRVELAPPEIGLESLGHCVPMRPRSGP
jgi:hypothetical protein